MKDKKGAIEISMEPLIIAIIGIIFLLLIVTFFTGGLGSFFGLQEECSQKDIENGLCECVEEDINNDCYFKLIKKIEGVNSFNIPENWKCNKIKDCLKFSKKNPCQSALDKLQNKRLPLPNMHVNNVDLNDCICEEESKDVVKLDESNYFIRDCINTPDAIVGTNKWFCEQKICIKARPKTPLEIFKDKNNCLYYGYTEDNRMVCVNE